MDLVIMAAGMGSRFGGLKQIEKVHKNGEFIIDYYIYDAIKAGFNRVVFIIKEENYELFRETIGKRIEKNIETVYVFQNNNNVPKWVNLPDTRVKPLGTAHAILCCKDIVKNNFVVINSDDFYGYDAFKVASSFLKNNQNNNEFANISYIAGNTLTNVGAVKRGVLKITNGYLDTLIESSLEKEQHLIKATPLNEENSFYIENNSLVSMNMFAFTPKIFELLENEFDIFFKDNKDNLQTCEYLLPDVVCKGIKDNKIKVKALSTTAVWYGMTYKEDKELLVSAINEMVKQGLYPDNLWN